MSIREAIEVLKLSQSELETLALNRSDDLSEHFELIQLINDKEITRDELIQFIELLETENHDD